MPAACAIHVRIVTVRIEDTMATQKRYNVNFVRGMEADIDYILDLLSVNVGKSLFSSLSSLQAEKSWWNSLQEVLYETEDVLDEWDLLILKHAMSPSQAPKKVPFSLSWILNSKKLGFKKYFPETPVLDIGDRMKDLAGKLVRLVKGRWDAVRDPMEPKYFIGFHLRTDSSVNTEAVHGRDVDRDILVRKIIVEGNSRGKSGIQIIPIVGLAGMGKTTLAQLVYADSRVTDYYPLKIWVWVSKSFDLVSIAKEIIRAVQGKYPSTTRMDEVIELLIDSLSQKRYFLILDDVWEQDSLNWLPLKVCLDCGGEGSTVLVTTRNEGVARMMGARDMYLLRQLSDKSCWSILSGEAFSGRNKDQLENFKDVGLKIAEKCNGIPHTAKVLGRLLRSKSSIEKWCNVMESHVWELEALSGEIFGPLFSTYNELSVTLKCCFEYCCIIPKGCEVYAKKLIGCWFAEGYMTPKSRGQEYLNKLAMESLNELAMHSLFQEVVQDESGDTIMCKIHDVVLDCAQFLTKNPLDKGIGVACQVCTMSLDSHVKEYRSLVFQKDPPAQICDCLKSLRVLSLRDCGLESIPRDMIKLIHLRLLDLSYNECLSGENLNTICQLYYLETLFLSSCGLEEMPMEIGDLIQLKHLDLSFNSCLTELPESICNLLELRMLELDGCDSLLELPQGIHRLRKLKHLHNLFTKFSCPQGLGQLTSLCTLNEFSGKLSLLKELNQLSGSLQLRIPESYGLEAVAEAKEAGLDNKGLIKDLEILFEEDISETISMGILDALRPHRDLRYLKIELYVGTKLPGWIVSPFKDVQQIELQQCNGLLSLPALGKLPLLEELTVQEMDGLQCVGREFLGFTTSSSAVAANNVVAFPRLKVLIFYECPNWEEWEDITAEEQDSAKMSIMPCLKKLDVVSCGCLEVLPHRLLRKAAELDELDIYNSDQLTELYGDKEESNWNSISQIPRVRFA